MTHRGDPSLSVLAVRGAVDVSGRRRLTSAFNEALAKAPRRLVVDLRGVEFVDSTGLAVLIQARRRALRRGIQLRLICDAPATLRVLAVTGLAHAFDIYPTREAALQPAA